MEVTGYELSRQWFNFSFENPEKIRPIHSAIYFFAIEHCNRLGWKEKFGFPSSMAMDAIGVKNYHAYITAFNSIVDWGFITLLEKSKNQYSSNIIALPKNDKATYKALDKALSKHSIKHTTKQRQSTIQSNLQSIVSINKQYNNITKEQYNNITQSLNEFSKKYFDVKFINQKSADVFYKLITTGGYLPEQIKKAIAWARGDPFWSSNFLSPTKLNSKNKEGIKYIDVFIAKSLTNNKNGTNGNSKNDFGATWEEITSAIKSEFGYTE